MLDIQSCLPARRSATAAQRRRPRLGGFAEVGRAHHHLIFFVQVALQHLRHFRVGVVGDAGAHPYRLQLLGIGVVLPQDSDIGTLLARLWRSCAARLIAALAGLPPASTLSLAATLAL